MILSVADVDLNIASAPQGGQVLAVRFTAPQQPAATLARDVPVHLDHGALLSLSNDPDEYGETLTAQLFRDAAAHGAWARLRAFADGAGVTLRVRLHLDAADALTQGLRWETLHDPERDVPLGLSERALLSRLVDSDTLSGPITPSRPDLRATIAVAAPSDLAAYGLAQIDADDEIARARAALGEIPAITVGTHAEEPASRASLANLLAGLRAAPHVLLLICHGRDVAGETYLCLEDAQGQATWLPAQQLVDALRELPQLPLLAVLAACRSGGSGYGPALAALGPQLARAGVPAVIAFQGDVPISAVRQMLGPLFTELRRDGVIDRALAVTRRHGAGANWWQPALWLRSPDGRLWREPMQDRSTHHEPEGPVLSGTFYGPVVVNAPVTVHQHAPPPIVSADQIAAGEALIQQIPVSPPDPLPKPATLPRPHRMPLAANRSFVDHPTQPPRVRRHKEVIARKISMDAAGRGCSRA